MIKASASIYVGKVESIGFTIPEKTEENSMFYSQILWALFNDAVNELKKQTFYGIYYEKTCVSWVTIKSHSPVWDLDIDDIEI